MPEPWSTCAWLQEDVYSAVEADQLIATALDGFSVTVFAFGAPQALRTHGLYPHSLNHRLYAVSQCPCELRR